MFRDVLGRYGTFWYVLVHFGMLWDILGEVRTFCYVLVHFVGVLWVFWEVLGRFATYFSFLGEILDPNLSKVAKSSQKSRKYPKVAKSSQK